MKIIILTILLLCFFVLGAIINDVKKEMVYEEMIRDLLNNNQMLVNELQKVKINMVRESRTNGNESSFDATIQVNVGEV